jgi:hypothetical protein
MNAATVREMVIGIVSSILSALILFLVAYAFGWFDKQISDTQLNRLASIIIYDQQMAQVLLDRMDNSGKFKGDTGSTGPRGDKGEQGEKGEVGQQGPRGLKGDTGAVVDAAWLTCFDVCLKSEKNCLEGGYYNERGYMHFSCETPINKSVPFTCECGPKQ